jgi:POLQ-like helicase
VGIVLRSAFLSGRARVPVVVAPSKALCHEIGTTLRQALKATGLKVNGLSDAVQLDFLDQIAELLGNTAFIVSNTRTPVERACAAPYRTARHQRAERRRRDG